MKVIILSALLAAAAAVPPIWYPDGECGLSKYADAGDGCPLGTPCTRVVGGIDARENEFPYQASLRTGGHFCGGVVLSDWWVVTAAHCTVGDEPGDFTVVLGAHFRSSSIPSEITYALQAVMEHERYELPGEVDFDHDISMLKTSTQIAISENIAAVCAPDPDLDYVDAQAEISGWGTTSSGGSSPDTLMYTTVLVYANEYCGSEEMYGPGEITAGMICSSDDDNHFERDTCQGDSGGPMAVREADGFHVIGLTSWGFGCASGYPGVYNRIGFYAGWVTDKIEKN